MNFKSIRRAVVPGVAALALTLTACGSSDDEGGSGSTDAAELSGELSVGGASSQESAQNAWIVGFSEIAPDVTINYDPIGSGGGRENFASGAFPFAGSDSYLADEELATATETCGSEPIEIPNYVSPIAVVYNVEGVDELNLSPEVLAGIFAGEIKKWNDPAIVADNEGADLPDENITAVHRSDESGTTGNFTDYLAAVAPDVWTHGSIEIWPEEITGDDAGKGTSGVVDTVTRNANTIGYADASQAGGLAQANVGVGEEFVAPSPEAAARILEVSPRVEGRSDVDMAVDLDFTTQEEGTYPIVLTSYLLACQSYDDENTADMVKAYLEYVVSDEGQELAKEEAGSAPLAEDLQSEAQGIIEKISAS
ncbi:phosphate ABC transporter substrate-binding protein PstS [Nocardioides sp. SYSU DS0651]|uniref:phosphate ABC transporter substrate-binding protein PstS n=1 Tax=Nocardioides sp. SYSU DS0651 TaxID=3415955 RepID=UPI003F4C7E00